MIVSVSELKAHLRIEYGEEDEYLKGLLAQAQAAAEDFCMTTFSDPAPEAVRLAILLYASHYYEVRDNYDKQAWLALDMAWRALLWPHRDVSKLV